MSSDVTSVGLDAAMLAISPVDRVFVLTGADVSAESRIPTSRGIGGPWRNYRIEEVASPHAWRRGPRLVWKFYSMRRRVAPAAFLSYPIAHNLDDSDLVFRA